MKLFVQTCICCKTRVYRSNGRINEAKKSGWRTYCLRLCQAKNLDKPGQFHCSRINCGKTFLRAPHDIKSTALYCSRHCAAIVNNSKFPKRKVTISQCAYCHQKFKGRQMYCSKECKNKSQTISGKEILKRIRVFYKKYSRIPMKIEFTHYGAAQDRFGSWNKAILAAGFEPNPVKFAKRYRAKDGHECDSFAEKIIDDWLHEKGIGHERNKKYPDRPRLTADFITERHWIEFFGLAGEIKEYDALIRKKQRIAKKYKLPLVTLYPKDLFPKNNLSGILN